MKFKNIAFTLAETLVVMGIIGVIAALTIPNLSQSTGNRERVTKVKKAYSTLSEAFDRAQAVYGPIDDWFTSDMDATAQATRFGSRIVEFMKVSKDCKNGTGCWSSTSGYDSSTTNYKFLGADGISFMVAYNASGTTSANADMMKGFKTAPITIWIDIDGLKSKVEKGKSLFAFRCFSDNQGLRPNGYQYALNDFINDMKSGSTKYSAARWVIDYENLDYLKMDADWKCPNGKVLNLTANPPITSCN